MALTRKFLSALGIEADKIDEIITAHTETVDALKEQRDQFKADAEKLPAIQKELDGMKEAAEKDGGKVWETKYNALKEDKQKVEEEFNQYKESIKAKETQASKEKAYRDMLKDIGVSEKRIDAILRVTDLNSVELDEKGAIKDADNTKESAKKEWADFIVTDGQKGVRTPMPPEGNGNNEKQTGRAAKIAAQYHANLYGENKEG